MMKKKLTQFQKVWRLFILLSCLAAVITMVEYGSNLAKQNYRTLSDQTQQLSRLVVRQAADTASTDVIEKNQDRLQLLVEQLAKEPLLLDASIYDLEGITLAKSQDALPLPQVTGLSTPLAVASYGRQQLIEPIMSQHQVVGFVRITLEHDKLIAETMADIDAITNIIRTLIASAMVIGFLLAITFGNRKENWHFPVLPSEVKND
ncbi:YtjB family periplasmic protein [Photobacterium sp. DNB23_23_1]